MLLEVYNILWRDKSENLIVGDHFVHLHVAAGIILKRIYSVCNVKRGIAYGDVDLYGSV